MVEERNNRQKEVLEGLYTSARIIFLELKKLEDFNKKEQHEKFLLQNGSGRK
jgi:hypothetical protein